MSESKPPLVHDPALQELVRRKARKLSRRAGFRDQDQEDVAQALFAGLLQRLAGLGPDRRHRAGFLVTVIEQVAANLVRHRRAPKRDSRRVRSLSTLAPGDHKDAIADPGTGTSAEQAAARASGRSHEELADLRADVAAVIQGLPPHLRDLAERLMDNTIAEIARATGTPPSTLQYRRRLLREVFERKNLRDYL